LQPSECPIHSCIGPNLCARPLRASGRSLGRRRAANHPAHQRAVSGPGTILRFRPIAVMFGGLEHRGCAARRAYHIRCGCLVRNRWRARSPPVPNSSPPLALRRFECPKNVPAGPGSIRASIMRAWHQRQRGLSIGISDGSTGPNRVILLDRAVTIRAYSRRLRVCVHLSRQAHEVRRGPASRCHEEAILGRLKWCNSLSHHAPGQHQTSDVAFDATIVAFTVTPVTCRTVRHRLAPCTSRCCSMNSFKCLTVSDSALTTRVPYRCSNNR